MSAAAQGGGANKEDDSDTDTDSDDEEALLPPPPPQSAFFTTTLLLELGVDSLMRVQSNMFLGLRDLARISRTSKEYYMETERATKSMLLELVTERKIMPWVARVGRGPHMERVGNRSFKRLMFELTRTRILLMGGGGGFDRVDVVDVTRNLMGLVVGEGKWARGGVVWETCPSMPGGGRAGFVAVYRRGEVVVASRGCADRFDVISRRWVEVEHKAPQVLVNVSAALLNDKIYVTGGCFENAQGAWVPTNTVLTLEDSSSSSSSSFSSSLLDPTKATFVQQEDAKQLITARRLHASAVHDNKLWISGGADVNNHALRSVEVLDLAVGRMEMRAQSMQRERAYHSLVKVNGELYAVGGDCTLRAEGGMSIEKMSNKTGAWQVIVDECQGGGPRFYCAVVAVDSKIFVFGGCNADDTIFNRTWDAFDVSTQQWASATIPKKSRKLPRKQFYFGQAVVLPPLIEMS